MIDDINGKNADLAKYRPESVVALTQMRDSRDV